MLEVAAPMHDIGKIGIPDAILLKEGPLTKPEDEVMRTHPRIGYDILKGSPSKYLSMGAIIALGHHEKFDGSGYPNGLHGDDIPLVARIVAVADVFDALVSERPYKHAWPVAEGIDYLKAQRGTPLRSAVRRRVPRRSARRSSRSSRSSATSARLAASGTGRRTSNCLRKRARMRRASFAVVMAAIRYSRGSATPSPILCEALDWSGPAARCCSRS